MILLDTCTLLWLVRGEGLPPAVAARIADPEAAVYVSAISAFEIGVKHARGRLGLPLAPRVWWDTVLTHHALAEVPVEAAIALAAAALPPLHADPADRILVATALHLDALLLTPDEHIAAYPGVRVAWSGAAPP